MISPSQSSSAIPPLATAHHPRPSITNDDDDKDDVQIVAVNPHQHDEAGFNTTDYDPSTAWKSARQRRNPELLKRKRTSPGSLLPFTAVPSLPSCPTSLDVATNGVHAQLPITTVLVSLPPPRSPPVFISSSANTIGRASSSLLSPRNSQGVPSSDKSRAEVAAAVAAEAVFVEPLTSKARVQPRLLSQRHQFTSLRPSRPPTSTPQSLQTQNRTPNLPPSPPLSIRAFSLPRSPPADRPFSSSRSSATPPPRPPARLVVLREARSKLAEALSSMVLQDRGPPVVLIDESDEHLVPQQTEPRWKPDGNVWLPRPGIGVGAIPGVARGSNSRLEVENCLTTKGGRNVPLVIFHTRTAKGWGLRSPDPISAGQLVLLFTGQIISSSMASRMEGEGRGRYILALPGGEYVVDAWCRGGPGRFLNHSCEPNLESRAVDIAISCCEVNPSTQAEESEDDVISSFSPDSGSVCSSNSEDGTSLPLKLSSTLPLVSSSPLQPVIAFYALRSIAAQEELTFDCFPPESTTTTAATDDIVVSPAVEVSSSTTTTTSALLERRTIGLAHDSVQTLLHQHQLQLQRPTSSTTLVMKTRRNPVRGAAGRCLCASDACRRIDFGVGTESGSG